ncbi:MAG TPA: transposase [Rhodocyclaceae bacterium]|nr:transposase [Rhodocyclaceae bacterium]
MVFYRRNYVPGGTFFFTVTLRDRRSDLLVRHVDLLRDAVAAAKAKRAFTIDAMVVMPDHVHAIWTLPEDDHDYSGRWRLIKSAFVRGLAKSGVPIARNARGEADVWQRRFWEHTIRDDADFERHADYIHFNPVKHGYVSSPADWPHSSIHRYVEQGLLSRDWGAGVMFSGDSFGEAQE